MSYDYSENVLVQGAAGDLLKNELGWELVYAYKAESLGASGTLGRTDYHEVLLTRYLRPALFRLNSWMTDGYADMVGRCLSWAAAHAGSSNRGAQHPCWHTTLHEVRLAGLAKAIVCNRRA